MAGNLGDSAMSRSFLGFALASVIGLTLAAPAVAADYEAHPRSSRYVTIDRGPNPYCGPRYGCPEVTYVRHRSLRQYYESSFDPRERDEPRYAYGAVKTYARFENLGAPEGYYTK
jgi:hypothetical protein